MVVRLVPSVATYSPSLSNLGRVFVVVAGFGHTVNDCTYENVNIMEVM